MWMQESDKDKYMQSLWDMCPSSNDGVFHYTVMDIAWSLHIIAEMLMEQNGYVHCDKYMNGEAEE